VLDIAFDGFDKVGNQVVAPSQLHVNLREGVLDAVAFVDQPVVNADPPHDNRCNDREEYQE